MTTPSGTPDDADIDAYLDGGLSAEARLAIERAAAAHPDLAHRLRADRAILDALRRTYAGVLDEPLPARLLMAAAPRPWPWWRRAVAAAACLLAGAGIGWQAALWDEAARVAAARPVSVEAIAAHSVYVPEVRHAVEVDSSQRAHLDRWLSKRLAHPLVSPDLRAFGFDLVGGRLLPDSGRPAAQYMYQSADGERITIYVRGEPRAQRASPPRFGEDRGFGVVFWDEDLMSYAVTGRLPRERLERLAGAVHEQL